MRDIVDPLSDALGLPALEPRREVTVVVPTPDKDREVARESLHKALAWAEQAIEEMGGVAYSSQHPRAYEVHTGQLAQFVETARALADMADEEQVGPKTVNNTLIMTGAEALDMVKKKIRGEDPPNG